MDKMREQVRRLSGRGIIVHAGFVLSVALILIFAFKYYFGDIGHAIEKQECISILYFFVCVYTGRWICKTWFLKNQFIAFSIFCAIGFVVLLYVGKIVLNGLLPLNKKNVDEFFFAITPLFILGMLVGVFIPMIRALLQRKTEEAIKMVEQKQDELNLLQSQLSPHFLFNTLNNLYGIALTQHEKIPGLLLKLSELLRYSVYETRQLFIPLEDELQYIRNYISFEEIRIGERLDLKTNIEVIAGRDVKIAPMLLIVFVENAFKHSRNSLDKVIFINIRLRLVDGNIIFAISNSCSNLKGDNSISDKEGGLGLDNVKRRLQLLYADGYALREMHSDQYYSVVLQLKTKSLCTLV